MDLGIKGRIAIVAAASKGLGREVARSLAAEGVRLAICARDAKLLKQAADGIRKDLGAEVVEVVADLTRENEAKAVVEKTIAHYGSVDILVSNCGGPPPGEFLEHETERWRQAVELNLMSAVFLCQAVVPVLLKKRWGRIVLMTSVSVKQPLEGLILSNSVRAAVVGLGKSLANELGKHNVLVNSVCPGYFLTERVQSLAMAYAQKSKGKPEELLAKFARESVLGRVGEPQEFGALVAFLCSERASYITGSAIAIDGGMCRSLL